MIRVVVRADLNTSIDTREKYKSFCEDIENQHSTANVLSAEIGGEARVELETSEEEYMQDDYRSKFTDLEVIEQVKTIDRLAE